MSDGDPVVVLYLDLLGRTHVNLTAIQDASRYEFRVVANAFSAGPASYRYTEEGLTWCRINPEAVQRLEAAVALGLEAPDEPF